MRNRPGARSTASEARAKSARQDLGGKAPPNGRDPRPPRGSSRGAVQRRDLADLVDDAKNIFDRQGQADLLRRARAEAERLGQTLEELAQSFGHIPPTLRARPSVVAHAIVDSTLSKIAAQGEGVAVDYAELSDIASAIGSAIGGFTMAVHERHQHGGLPLPDEHSEADVRARLARLAGARPADIGRAAAPREDGAEAARKRDSRRRATLEPSRLAAREGIDAVRRTMQSVHKRNLRQLEKSIAFVDPRTGETKELDLEGIPAEVLEQLLARIEGFDDQQRESLLYVARAASSMTTQAEVERVALVRYVAGVPAEPITHDVPEARPRRTAFRLRASATTWLRGALGAGPREGRDVIAAGHAAGHSDRTLHRARGQLGVVIERTGRGAAHRSIWSLPVQTTPATRGDPRSRGRARHRS